MMMMMTSDSDRSQGDSSTPPPDPAETNRPSTPASGAGSRAKAKAKPRAKLCPRPIEVMPPPTPEPAADAPASPAQDSPASPALGTGQLVLTHAQWAQTAARHKLSPQHLTVVQHLFDDETASGAAYLMGIEESCVRTYIRRIYKKLGVSSQIAMTTCILEPFITNNKNDSQPGLPRPKSPSEEGFHQ